jgi:hypothetical protein
MPRILSHLEAHQVPTPSSARPHLARQAHHWNVTSIHRVLRNPWYAGVVTWGETINTQGEHPALVDFALFARVQELLPLRRWHRLRAESGPRWLQGLARCGWCGYTMVFFTRPGGAVGLRCSRYANTRGRECRSNSQLAASVHDHVLDALTAALADPAGWLAAREAQADTAAIRARLDAVERAISANRATHARAYDAYLAGATNLNEFAATRSRLDGEHADLRSEAANLRVQTHAPPDLPQVGDVHALDADALRSLAYALLARVLVQRGESPVLVWL